MTAVSSYRPGGRLRGAVPVDPVGIGRAGQRGDESPLRRERYKRPFDLAVLALAGLGLLPVWLALGAAIALAVRLESRGPALYRQLRLGRERKAGTLQCVMALDTPPAPRAVADLDGARSRVAGGRAGARPVPRPSPQADGPPARFRPV